MTKRGNRKSDYELEVDEYHRWAEPLETGLERLLAPDPPPSEAPSWRVEVQVDRFDVDTAGTALLDARWTARPPDKGPPLEHTFRARRQAPDSTPENRAAALSALALDLKAEIGQAITDARME